jgi:hypothetical protein
MTVQELKEELNKFPDNARVVLRIFDLDIRGVGYNESDNTVYIFTGRGKF